MSFSGTTFFMAALMIRNNTCIGIATGLKVAAIWLELLYAATISQITDYRLYHSSAMLLFDKSSGIVFFTALCIIRGRLCRQTFRNV